MRMALLATRAELPNATISNSASCSWLISYRLSSFFTRLYFSNSFQFCLSISPSFK